LDASFQGCAVQAADKEGRYQFKTIKPGSYPADVNYTRPPHIHFKFRGKKSRLVTEMFFPGEALNEKDPLFLMLGKDSADPIIRILPAVPEVEPDSLIVPCDIILYQHRGRLPIDGW
jgi:protocatechuate 3,4-dioxygenase beta subunit